MDILNSMNPIKHTNIAKKIEIKAILAIDLLNQNRISVSKFV